MFFKIFLFALLICPASFSKEVFYRSLLSPTFPPGGIILFFRACIGNCSHNKKSTTFEALNYYDIQVLLQGKTKRLHR